MNTFPDAGTDDANPFPFSLHLESNISFLWSHNKNCAMHLYFFPSHAITFASSSSAYMPIFIWGRCFWWVVASHSYYAPSQDPVVSLVHLLLYNPFTWSSVFLSSYVPAPPCPSSFSPQLPHLFSVRDHTILILPPVLSLTAPPPL